MYISGVSWSVTDRAVGESRTRDLLIANPSLSTIDCGVTKQAGESILRVSRETALQSATYSSHGKSSL